MADILYQLVFLTVVFLQLSTVDSTFVGGQTLRPIRNTPMKPIEDWILNKRSDGSLFDLQEAEEFLWGADDESNAVVGSLTVFMPQQYENILNAEKFSPLINSLTCDSQGVSMVFRDEATFEHAKRVWNWANGAEDNHFVLVIGAGDCGDNEDRQPYVVRNLEYDEAANAARLIGEPKDWNECAHSYDLNVGHVPQSGAVKRGVSVGGDKDSTLNFNKHFPFGVELKRGRAGARLDCVECFTKGELKIHVVGKVRAFKENVFKVTMWPSGIQAMAKLKLALFGEVKKELRKETPRVTIPVPGGFRIAKILNLGSGLDIFGALALGSMKAQSSITGGFEASISDSTVFKIDVLEPSVDKSEDDALTTDVLPWKVESRLTASFDAFLAVAFTLNAEFCGRGYRVALELRAPTLSAKVDGITSSKGACEGDDDHAGLRASLNIGASLNAKVTNVHSNKDHFSLKLFTKERYLKGMCWEIKDREEDDDD